MCPSPHTTANKKYRIGILELKKYTALGVYISVYIIDALVKNEGLGPTLVLGTRPIGPLLKR